MQRLKRAVGIGCNPNLENLLGPSPSSSSKSILQGKKENWVNLYHPYKSTKGIQLSFLQNHLLLNVDKNHYEGDEGKTEI